MKSLSVANTQMVEIAKAISYDASLIIMDEPTSAITEREVAHLFRMIRALRETRASHHLHHPQDGRGLPDRGRHDGLPRRPAHRDGAGSGATDRTLIAMMVGRELTNIFPKEDAPIGEVVMSVRGLTRTGIVEDVTFDLRQGEILGLAGLMGAGRTEVIEGIFGVTKIDAGEIWINGKKVRSTRRQTRSRRGSGC